MFTGQGSQSIYSGMEIYKSNVSFKRYMDECDAIFEKYIDKSIIKIINGDYDDSELLINKTVYTQPVLFSIEYSMAKMLMEWGCYPSILIGHSVGEIVAACISGLFSLSDAIKLVAHRGLQMQSVTKDGSMLAVQASREKVNGFLEAYSDLDFASFNGPQQCVVSGSAYEIAQLVEELTASGIINKRLPVSHAFHSSHMEDTFPQFRKLLEEIEFNQPEIPFISNITGDIAKYGEVSVPEYWLQHMRQPVDFLSGMERIASRGAHTFIELGPNPHLIGLGKRCVVASEHLWIPCLDAKQSEIDTLENAVKGIYESGVDLDWFSVHGLEKDQCCQLPLYPFEKKRYWLPKSTRQSTENSHPLLGSVEKVSEKEWRFEAHISSNSPAYLADHIIKDKIIFPGAGYMEIALALQDSIFGHTNYLIKDFFIKEPLFLEGNSSTKIITTVVANEDGEYDVTIESSSGSNPNDVNLRSHVTCLLSPKHESLEEFARDTFEPDLYKEYSNATNFRSEEMYEGLYALGLMYGAQFRKVSYCERTSKTSVYGKIASHESSVGEILNPTLLDAVLHTMGALDYGKTLLPVGFEKFQLFKKPRGRLESEVRLIESTNSDKYDICADIAMYSEGSLVFAAHGLGLKEVKDSKRKPESSFIHQLSWKKSNLNLDDFHESYAVLVSVASKLDASNISQLFPTNLSSVQTIEQLPSYLKEHPECSKLVLLWGNEDNNDALSSLSSTRFQFESLLNLINILESDFYNRDIQILFVTQGAQVLPMDRVIERDISNLLQSTIWGFNNVLNNEHSRFNSKCIDLPIAVAEEKLNNTIVQEIFLCSDINERQVSYRGGDRYVRRIHKADLNFTENFELTVQEYGTLSGVAKEDCDVSVPKGDEIKVKVKAAGVNFKDVLNTLGMLKQHAEDNGQIYEPLPLGFECAGIVVAAGESAEFNVGDEVIISQVGCMKRYLTTSSKVAVRKPANISFEEAASIPTAFITSYYSLYELAGLKQDDKVLIHAAAGGVGQAAVQLAKRVGAEIYATASDSKRTHLHSQDINYIYDSRSLGFENQIKRDTNNNGVDVVLNSLNKDFIPASIDTLSKNGRFVEIGKIGVWSSEEVKDRREDVDYFNFDLSEMPKNKLDDINKNILQNIVTWVESGEIKPLPISVYPLDNIEEAFGVLSRGQNIGKVVLQFDSFEESQRLPTAKINEDTQYLITGGAGALGKIAAKWLSKQGASNIVLVNRNIPDTETQSLIKEEIGSTNISFVSCDISEHQSVRSLIESLNEKGRVAGIIHAAGVLSDAPILRQSWQDFRTVFDAKVLGTWWLSSVCDELNIDLDFFIGYSSIASVIGSVSQSNYAAANAFIDTLMLWRSKNDKHGLSVNWGPWADVGMAANLTQHQIRSIEEKGVTYIQVDKGIASLESMLGAGISQGLVGDYNWNKYLSSVSSGNNLFDAVNITVEVSDQSFNIGEFSEMSVVEKEQYILDSIRIVVAKILQFESIEQIPVNARFSDLGLDSLVAVELRNSLENTFQLAFPSSLVFDYPSLPKLTEYILSKLDGDSPSNSEESDTFENTDTGSIVGSRVSKLFKSLSFKNTAGR
ncbi:SDR family NAD(P)-dependent oxidoreductase [Photorhabdus tasmaniensis]|uniref:SDR family NAD(P)-dependent oxidoreductase n=1 Tax=Photorhabdus tasmaniensis TaxID=1004159 RepID=UPI004042DF17